MANKNPIIDAFIVNARIPAVLPQRKALIIGQSNDADITSGVLYTEILNDKVVIKAQFGGNENLTKSILAFRENNPVNRLDVIPLNDNGVNYAGGLVVFTGSAAEENGTLKISIGSSYFNKYEVSVSKDDTPTEIGDALEALITADDLAWVSGVNTAGSVALTANNAGTVGNDIGIRVEGEIAGITSTITAMTAGSTDPVLTSLFDVIAKERYDVIIAPLYVQSVLATELDSRFNPSNTILDGIGYFCEMETATNQGTSLDAIATRNINYECNKKINDADLKGGAILEQPTVIAARKGAFRILKRTQDANIARYMQNGLTSGGVPLNSIPYFNTEIAELPVIPTGKEYSDLEIATLEGKGGSVMTNNDTKTKIIMNKEFVVDVSITPNNRVQREDLIREVRETRFFRNKLRYVQSRLVSDGQEKDGQPDVSPSSYKADALGDWKFFVKQSLVRTKLENGESAKQLFIDTIESSFTINYSTGTITNDFLVSEVVALDKIIERIIPDFQ